MPATLCPVHCGLLFSTSSSSSCSSFTSEHLGNSIFFFVMKFQNFDFFFSTSLGFSGSFGRDRSGPLSACVQWLANDDASSLLALSSLTLVTGSFADETSLASDSSKSLPLFLTFFFNFGVDFLLAIDADVVTKHKTQ